MGYKIFYSYQSDSLPHLNHEFIGDALDEAVKQITDYEIEPVEGFKRVPGRQDLLMTMLRQSKEADIFVGDVTYTSAREYLDAELLGEHKDHIDIRIPRNKRKASPNPNVLLETGYSWGVKETKATLLVMNTAFGDPGTEKLPADMQGLGWPIRYKLDQAIYDDENERERVFGKLVDELVDEIVKIIEGEADYQQEQLLPFRTYNNWKNQDFKEAEFKLGALHRSSVERIREFAESTLQALRITGVEKSGKSRVVYEAFNSLDADLKEKTLYRNRLVYVDCNSIPYSEIIKTLLTLNEKNKHRIIVVDNCNQSQHSELIREYLYASNLKLITVGVNTDSEKGDLHFDLAYKHRLISEVIHLYFTEESAKAAFLVKEAKGDLSKALVLVKKYYKLDLDAVAEDLNYVEQWQRRLGQQLFSSGGLDVLEVISAFKKLGYSIYFQSHIGLLSEVLGIDSYEHLIQLLNGLEIRGYLSKDKEYYYLEGHHSELFQKWLEKLTHESARRFIQLVVKHKAATLFNLSYAENDIPDILLSQLLGKDGLIKDLNFLDSAEGASLFQFLSVKYPEKTLEAISTVFSGASYNDYSKLGSTWSLVDGLSNLSRRRETYRPSVDFLFNIVLTDKGPWGSSFVQDFVRLFLTYSENNTVPLSERIKFLSELHKSGIEGSEEILDRSLESALAVSYEFYAVPDQDQEYVPSREEFIDSWNQSFEILLDKGKKGNENAYRIIREKFDVHTQKGEEGLIFSVTERMIQQQGEINSKLRQTFTFLLEKGDTKASVQDFIQRMISTYEDDSFATRLKSNVAFIPHTGFEIIKHKRVSKADLHVQDFAKELIGKHNLDWLADIDVLLQGQQSATFTFGLELAKLVPYNTDITNAAIDSLRKIERSSMMNQLMIGYLSASEDQDFVRATLDQYLATPEIRHLSVWLTKTLKQINLPDIQKLIPVIKEDEMLVRELEYINLNTLSVHELLGFINEIQSLGERGLMMSLLIVASYVDEKKNELSKDFIPLIKKVVLVESILSIELYHDLFYYRYNNLIKTLHELGAIRKEDAAFFANEVVNQFMKDANRELDAKDMIEFLFMHYWDIAWPIVALKIQSGEWRPSVSFGMNSVLGWFSYDPAKLLEWMDKYPNEAPQFIVEIINFKTKDVNDNWRFTALAVEMLDRYAKNAKFLSRLSTRMWNVADKNSRPWFQDEIKMLESIRDHHNSLVREFVEEQLIRFKRDQKSN